MTLCPLTCFPRHPHPIWIVALASFGFGDVVTTSIGIGMAGVAEAGPIPAVVLQHAGFGAMVSLKAAVFVLCYVLWRLAPSAHRVGIPIGLSLVGISVTGWNLYVLTLLTAR